MTRRKSAAKQCKPLQATSTSSSSELAEQWYQPGLKIVILMLRYCLYVTCLTIASFTLIGLLFDQEYVRHFLHGLDSWVISTHQIFQSAVQFSTQPHCLPMFRFKDAYVSLASLGKCETL